MLRCVTSVLAVILACGTASAQAENARDRAADMDFQGRYIVSVQDADMVASAYVTGALGPREGGDTLAVIPLAGDPRGWTAAEIFASNSVAGPPASIEIARNGRFAYVIETFTPRPDTDEDHSFADLNIGTALTVVDLTAPERPRVLETKTILARPLAVRANPEGTLLAVSYSIEGGAGAQTPLQFFPIRRNGTLGQPVTPEVPGYPLGEDNIIDMDWHPDGDVLVMIDQFGNTMRFARFTGGGTIEPFGNVVEIERAPYRVFFTPDGRHAVTNAVYWGPDIAGTWIEAPRGSIVTVRMNAEVREDGSVRHALVDRVQTGVSPEGLAVSPDGRWVAATNLERSYLPYEDDRITWFSSLTLARLDPETGGLESVGTFAYDGILPEAAVFDNSSTFLAVATFDHFDDRIEGGAIDFWRLQADPLSPEDVHLIKTQISVPVARGAHSMVIAR